MPEWTTDQQRTIDTRDKNILVSAAAGSGKTAVLVERIKKLIIEEHVDVDRFLITTFTKAASEEMRQRLESAIREEMSDAAAADRAFLLRQLQLLPGAAIGTFHSFATDIIRQYFYLTDLEPGFTTADEVQTIIMKREAINQVFERRYGEQSEEFFDYLEKYSNDRSDDALKESLIKMYNSLRSIPFYMDWARERTELMNSDSPVKALGLADYMESETLPALERAAKYFDDAAALLDTPDTKGVYAKASADAVMIHKAIENIEDRDALIAFFGQSFNSMGHVKGDSKEAYEKVKVRITELRQKGKDLINDQKKGYYAGDPEEYDEEIKAVYKYTKYMVDILDEFEHVYRDAKNEANIIDMDDVMHYAIDILQDEKAAAEQRERFRYIFVDEYQDSNMLQEAIVKRIARNDNLFLVGDVKQSIYKFRLAEPEIFIDKAKTYKRKDETDSMVIDLNKNFRSKSNITGAVNAVFGNVMPDYDENAMLHCMAPENEPGYPVGIHIINKASFEDDTESEGSEAEIVAEIIKDAVGETIYDVKAQKTRTVRYKDIAVLARASSIVAEIESYLNNEGIPAYGDTGEGYYETVEVQVFINLLRVIDNMSQDVPLISVMRSAIFNFNVRELAKIRINKRDGSFCAAVREYMNSGPDPDLRQKLADMENTIKMWKELGRTVPLEELVRVLLYDTGYYDYCSGLPVGRQRISNLQIIVEKAQDFEKTDHSGLNGFLRYIEAMAESNTSEAEAKTISESEDVVRVMTVHKSKGLEFPVVILAGAGRKVGGGGRNSAPMHKDFGIGLQLINKEEHWKKKTLLQNVISKKQAAENFDESVRILYVAMTRAIDRLEIVGSIKTPEELKDEVGKKSYLDMIYGSLKGMDNVRIAMYEKNDAEEESFERAGRADDLLGMINDVGSGQDDPLAKEINRRLSFEYEGPADGPAKIKYSVTELNKESAGEGTDDSYIDIVPMAEFEPDMTKHKLSAAEIGTVMHLMMEKMDFTKARDEGEAYIEAFADGLAEAGRITPEEREAVSTEKLAAFFETETGHRAAKAFEEGKLYREKEFIMEKEIRGETAVVQGIIDCWFEGETGPVLIDYKNSYMGSGRTIEDVRNTYQKQIEIYKEALETALGRKVEEAYLYLFDIGTFVQIYF